MDHTKSLLPNTPQGGSGELTLSVRSRNPRRQQTATLFLSFSMIRKVTQHIYNTSSSQYGFPTWSLRGHVRRRLSRVDNAKPPPETGKNDAFQIFNLPRTFLIDEDALKNSYRKLMTEYHPDKRMGRAIDTRGAGDDVVTTATPRSSSSSSSSSSGGIPEASTITQAYDMLRRKHTRATHLLEIMGHPLDESTSTNLVGGPFLMEIMELRESVENAHSDAELQQLLETNQQAIDETCHRLATAVEQSHWDKALELTAQLQYWTRVDETIRAKMDVS